MLMQIILLAIAVSAMSVTLTKGKIFRTQRVWVSKRSSFLGGLLACPYCMSHWIAALTTLVWAPNVWQYHFTLAGDYILTVFLMVGLSAIWTGTILKLTQFGPDDIPVRDEEALSLLRDSRDALADAAGTIKDVSQENDRLRREVDRLRKIQSN